MVGHLGPGLLGEWEVTSQDCSCSFLIGLLEWKIIPVHFLPTASLICIKKVQLFPFSMIPEHIWFHTSLKGGCPESRRKIIAPAAHMSE